MKNRGILLSAILIILICGVLLLWFLNEETGIVRIEDAPGCTLEALLCPDGSAVGRGGPSCSFTPCPYTGPLTGELTRDASGYRLITHAPPGMGVGVTYAVPIELYATNAVADALGRIVRAYGSFTEGYHFKVGSLEVLNTAEWKEYATLALGETTLINRVEITLQEVIEDSRCPVDVTCIQAGSVTTRVVLRSDTDTETALMTFPGTLYAFDAYSLSIQEVSPEPTSTTTINSQLYRVTFDVAPLLQN